MRILAIAALLASSIASGVTYELPELLPVHCGPSQYALSADRVYEHTSCSTGGRGSRPRQWSACAEVIWNADGSLASVETLWVESAQGTQYPHAEACL